MEKLKTMQIATSSSSPLSNHDRGIQDLYKLGSSPSFLEEMIKSTAIGKAIKLSKALRKARGSSNSRVCLVARLVLQKNQDSNNREVIACDPAGWMGIREAVRSSDQRQAK